MFHDNEEWYKTWKGTDLSFFKLTWQTSQILTRALKSLKNLCFKWLLVTKVYIVWAKKVQRSYLSRHLRDMQILKKNWLVLWKKNCEIWQISPEHLKLSKLGLWWDPFVQSRKGMTLNLQGSYVSWQWRRIQKLRRNWLVISKLTWGS